MIRSAIKNYFTNFKVVFSGMGVIYLAILIAVFAFFHFSGAMLADAANASVAELGEYLARLQNVTLENLFRDGFLAEYIGGLVDIFLLNGENVVLKLFELLFGLAAFVLLSMKAASFLMRGLIRRELRDGETKRGLLVLLYRFFASAATLSVVFVLSYVWIYSVFLLVALFAVFKAFEQLFTAWFLYCRNSFRLNEIFRLRHILNLLAADAVSIAINGAIVLLLALLFGVFFAVLIAIPLVVYTFTILDFTAVDYFNREKAKQKKSEDTEIAANVPDFNKPAANAPECSKIAADTPDLNRSAERADVSRSETVPERAEEADGKTTAVSKKTKRKRAE